MMSDLLSKIRAKYLRWRIERAYEHIAAARTSGSEYDREAEKVQMMMNHGFISGGEYYEQPTLTGRSADSDLKWCWPQTEHNNGDRIDAE